MTDTQASSPQSEAPTSAPAAHIPYVSAPTYQPDPNVSPLGRVRGISIASLVLGVASVPLGNLVLGIIGLVLAHRALKGTPPGVDNRFARVGKVCSIIGIVFSIVPIAVLILYITYSNRTMTF